MCPKRIQNYILKSHKTGINFNGELLDNNKHLLTERS